MSTQDIVNSVQGDSTDRDSLMAHLKEMGANSYLLERFAAFPDDELAALVFFVVDFSEARVREAKTGLKTVLNRVYGKLPTGEPCTHATYEQEGPVNFFEPVFTPNVTVSNVKAHGGTVYYQTCTVCGGQRKKAQNLNEVELSAWFAPDGTILGA